MNNKDIVARSLVVWHKKGRSRLRLCCSIKEEEDERWFDFILVL